MLLYAKQDTIGGRSYPVCHYPVAMRLRDRKGRAILCLRLSSKWGLVGSCTRSAFRRTPSHKNTLTLTKKRYASKTITNYQPPAINTDKFYFQIVASEISILQTVF